jgi:hypothetical protein
MPKPTDKLDAVLTANGPKGRTDWRGQNRLVANLRKCIYRRELLEPDEGKTFTSGSEGTGVGQLTLVTRLIRKGQASGCSADGGVVPLHAFIMSMFGFEG